MSVKTSFLQKIALVFLSLVLTVVILEAGLRAGGWIMSSVQDYQNRKKMAKTNVVRVMCIGESTTALGGKDSYPSQLERILNQNGGREFRVINKGIPMTNTEVIAQKIASWLKDYRPDIVVAMMGINDHNKLIPVDLSMKKENAFLSSFQTYKLYRWLVQNWRFKHQARDAFKRKTMPWPEVKKAIAKKRNIGRIIQIIDHTQNRALAAVVLQNLRSLSEWVPDNDDMYEALGDVLLKYRWYDELPEVIDYFLGRNYHHRWLYDKVAEGCRDKDLKSVVARHMKQRIAASPEDWQSLEFLGTCYAIAGDKAPAQQFFDQARQAKFRAVDPGTQANYLDIIETVRKAGADILLVQYPMRDVESLKALTAEDIHADQLMYVDNQKTFQDAVARDGYDTYFSDRFGGNFGHCTPKGNALLASDAARAVKKIFGSFLNKLEKKEPDYTD